MFGIEAITALMFASMLLFLALGLPVAFVLGGTAVIFGAVFWGPQSFYVILLKAGDTMNSSLLVAIPLFVFMALMLEKSGIAEKLFASIRLWLAGLPGSLASTTVIGCTIIAAMSGISTTGVLMMGIIALPAMLSRGYDKRLAMGSIMAGGALGALIPPSITFIVYASISDVSIGKLFLGGVLPGMLLSGLFFVYITVRCILNPDYGPVIPRDERPSLVQKLVSLRELVLPVVLIVAVLGSMFMGLATPTEASAVGAFGAILSTLLAGKLNRAILADCALKTLSIVAMVMWIVFAANVFASIYQGLGASNFVQGLLTGWQVHPIVVIILMQAIWILLGCMMDSLSILMITGPIFVPVSVALGYDPLLLGILFVMTSEIGYLSPPFGVNLYMMRSVASEEVASMQDIYASVLPFIALQLLGLILVMAFPVIALWLPGLVFAR
jgi:tripartite ATP-independent transporter DctM subunit